MAGFSTSAANAICNFYLRGIAMPTVRTLYFALFTSDPTDSTSTLVLLHQLPTPKTLTVNDVFDIQSQAASGDFTVRIL